jgi:DNA-binding NarL/FixJ family response regulator
VLSIHDEALFAERAIRAGARGYVMKQAAVTGLVHAIQEVLSGRMYVSERISQGPARTAGFGRGGRYGPAWETSPIANSRCSSSSGTDSTTASIAERLGVSVKTIETYRSNIKPKLELKDASDLIRFATMWTLNL